MKLGHNIERSKVKRVKVKGQGQRSGSKVKVTINGKEKAGGLTPTSSCFIKNHLLTSFRFGTCHGKSQVINYFLSPHVQLHSGLLCITFRLDVI